MKKSIIVYYWESIGLGLWTWGRGEWAWAERPHGDASSATTV